MKLEFEQGTIPEHLFSETGFGDFLQLFLVEMPIIPHRTLRLLNRTEAESHFSHLRELREQIERHRSNLNKLLELSCCLPNIDHVLDVYRAKRLDLYHLFDIGKFIQASLLLEKAEENSPLKKDMGPCSSMLKILRQYLSKDFSHLKHSELEEEQYHTILKLDEEIDLELRKLEKIIFKQTDLKIIYPFPRELPKDYPTVDKLKTCEYLQLSEEENGYRVEIVPKGQVEDLVKAREMHREKWQEFVAEKLAILNDQLAIHFESFSRYYDLRKARSWNYLLIHACQKHHLCLPHFLSEFRFDLKDGVLPSLRDLAQEHYKPLNIELQKGVNILFGANMTGKTTVLKSLYFLTTLIKFGLPVPAKSFGLGFPNRVKLQLRSSGKIGSGLSGFGEELQFFAEIEESSSIYLIDELFHSTDPINGVRLTNAFLTGLRETESILLCTSHYPEVLQMTGIHFFKMKEIDDFGEQTDLKKILESVPYEIESLTEKDLKAKPKHTDHPLKIALRYPLPERILNNLKKYLEN